MTMIKIIGSLKTSYSKLGLMNPNVIFNTKKIYGRQGNLQQDQMFNETSCMIFLGHVFIWQQALPTLLMDATTIVFLIA